MSTVTATLRECHRLRKHLKALQEEIDRGPRVLKAQQNRLAVEQLAHKDHHESITKLKLRQREDEGTLKQTEVRLAKLEEQLQKISVPKEYEAKKSEIRQAQEKRTALEDAILATMGEVEEKTAAVPAVEQKWKDAQAEFKQYEADARERLERLLHDQKESQAELAKVEATLPDKAKPTYAHLVKAYGPDAMAAVKARVCQGCRSSMHEQKWLELQSGTFTLCSSCGKMLYPAE
jgi:predicted  nucleic acid-binding Zn-ribbon protein